MQNKDRDELIMKKFYSGMKYSQIADEIGVSRQVVAGVIYRKRETEPNAKRARSRVRGAHKISDGFLSGTVRQLAEIHDIKPSTAYSRAKGNFCGWSFSK